MTTSKKLKPGETQDHAADAPPQHHPVTAAPVGRPVQFMDIGANNERARVALINRAAQLEQLNAKRGQLSAPEQEEHARIKHVLANDLGLFDSLFVAVDAMLSTIDNNHRNGSPDVIRCDIDTAPIQVYRHANTTAFALRIEEHELSSTLHPFHLFAAVYGMLAGDDVPPPQLVVRHKEVIGSDATDAHYPGFSKAFFSALGEFNASNELAAQIFPVLVRSGRKPRGYEVSATEYAQVLRYLVAHGVTTEEPQLERRVNEALDSVQHVGDSLPPSDITIDLPDLEDQTDNAIIADNIRAMQPTYFAAMFEELKVPQVVDKLAELFQNGVLPIGRGNAGNFLYKYWKDAANRIQEPERRSFYARTLGVPGGDDGGMPNREFNDLWLRFVSAVSQFVRQNNVDDLLRSRIPASISQQMVRKSGRDLAANLSLHGYGMAYFMATELQKMVKDFITLLSDSDIKSAYGARDMWQVIDQVATLELGGAKNSVKYRTMATSGAIIMAWLAKHARDLARSNFEDILDVEAIRTPAPRLNGTKATVDPSDYDLVNACEQWLAVTGTEDTQVESYAQPREAPMMTGRPIQIPSIAKDMLEAVGVPAMSMASAYRH